MFSTIYYKILKIIVVEHGISSYFLRLDAVLIKLNKAEYFFFVLSSLILLFQ